MASTTFYRAVVAAAAVGASVAIWLVAALAGASLDVTSPLIGTITIDLGLLVITTIPLVLGAWGLLALFERFATRARRTWTIVAVAVLILSLPPLFFLGATPSTITVLAAMHLATGLVLIVFLPRRGRERGAASTATS